MSYPSVAVTGLGVVCAGGSDSASALAAVKATGGRIGWVTSFEPDPGAPVLAAEVASYDLDKVLGSKKSYIDPVAGHYLAACAHALRDSGLDLSGGLGDEVGIAYGSAFGPLESTTAFQQRLAEKGAKLANPILFGHTYLNTAPSLAAIEWGIRGPNATVCSGWTSGMTALMLGVDMIRERRTSAVLAGASEALSEALYRGLCDAGLVTEAQDPSEWPQSGGIVPGEGGAVLVLEDEATARRRGAVVRARVLEACVRSDTDPGRALAATVSHCLSAAPDGSAPALYVSPASGYRELEEAERAALANAGRGLDNARVLWPARGLGETFAVAGPLYCALAIEALGPGEQALVAVLDHAGAGACLIRREVG